MVGEDVIAPFVEESSFLSNFHLIPGKMTFMGFGVITSEHAYQMMKTTDLNDRAWIALQPTAYKAKAAGSKKGLAGRKITLRPDWDVVKFSIMEQVVRAKFFQHAGLAKMLLMTGNARLVELNWWGDDIWGWCPKKGNGSNHLGHILETIRDELRRLELRQVA
jgi:ribA/ribD-fused uncharacterized protein